MGKCNWCGREVENGIYYGRWLFPSFYCSNRCLNRAISTGVEKSGEKSHTSSPIQRIINIVMLGAFAIPVLYALIDGIISYIVKLFN